MSTPSWHWSSRRTGATASRAGWTTEADLLDGQRTDAAAVRSIIDADDRFVLLAIDGFELRQLLRATPT